MRITDTSGEVLQKFSTENESTKKADTTKAVESGISQIKDDGFDLTKAVESIHENQSKESELVRKETGLTVGLKLKVASESMLPADAAIKKAPSKEKGIIAPETGAALAMTYTAGMAGIPGAAAASAAPQIAASQAASQAAWAARVVGLGAEAAQAAATEAAAAAATAELVGAAAATAGVAGAAIVGVAIGTGADKAYEAISGQSLGEDIADATHKTDTKEETEAKAEQGRREGAARKAQRQAGQIGQ